MCIEFLSNSQQHFVDVLSGAKLIIELVSTIIAIGGNRWRRDIDVVEVKVAFASKHTTSFIDCTVVGLHACGIPR